MADDSMPDSAAVSGSDGGARIFQELLDAEVNVNPSKLREASRAGIPPLYRSPVYRYLLGVAFVDKSCEMTLERSQEKDFAQLEEAFARLAASRAGGRRSASKGSLPPSLLCGDTAGVPLITREESPFANGYRCAARHAEDGYAAWLKVYAGFKYLPRFAGQQERRQRMEAAWRALLVVHSDATPDEVRYVMQLALPFESVHSTARDIFLSVQSLYGLLTHYGNVLHSAECLQQQCGTFLLLFRDTNFELYRHFMTEGVTVVEWLPGMLTTLLAGRLHEEDLLRLWDVYLADAFEHLSFPLHPYVCLAILAEMTEVLIECERSGIIERLCHLPRINVGSIIQKAISLKESIISKGLL